MNHDAEALEYHALYPPGKISVTATKPCQTQHDLSLAYSPGVAAPCMAIYREPELVYRYTAKANLVAVVSMATGLSLDRDFTADKTALLGTVGKYNGSEGTGFAGGIYLFFGLIAIVAHLLAFVYSPWLH